MNLANEQKQSTACEKTELVYDAAANGLVKNFAREKFIPQKEC